MKNMISRKTHLKYFACKLAHKGSGSRNDLQKYAMPLRKKRTLNGRNLPLKNSTSNLTR